MTQRTLAAVGLAALIVVGLFTVGVVATIGVFVIGLLTDAWLRRRSHNERVAHR